MGEWETEQKITSRILQSETEFITVRAVEFVDDFIFETIRPCCERTARMKISKPLLKRIITEYFQNHPEERESGDADES